MAPWTAADVPDLTDRDAAVAARLWDVSMQLTGVDIDDAVAANTQQADTEEVPLGPR